MHNIAAFIGGVASQEIIKLITHQYTPLNNTFIYNGMNSTTTTVQL
jgi:amyloid beta precursor protein binding protein 1